MAAPVATFKPELKAEARQDGTRAVRIRITKFRKHAYWNLGKYVLASQWNPKPSTKLHNYIQRHEDAPQYNNEIKKALSGLGQIADSLPAGTAVEIKAAYENHLNPKPEAPQPKRINFFAFADEYTTRLKDRTFHTGRCAERDIKEFKDLVGEHTPYPDLFSPKTLHKYLQHLKAQNNGPRTIQIKTDTLRRAYNAGVKEKQLPDIGHPFDSIKITVPKKKKVRPTADQVRQFISYEPKNEIQAMGKTVGMLQYLLQGARIGEALTLEWENVQDKYVEYLPQKGALKPKFIPRSNMLNKLLEQLPKEGRYVLPYIGEDYATMPANKKYYRKARIIKLVNEGLKEIAAELKIPAGLTSHQFRHAFADAVIATGSSIHVAAALLGHSNPKTTEGYIKDLQMEDVSAVSSSIFDALESEKPGKQQENI